MDYLHPDWLTQRLREREYLTDGAVTHIHVTKSATSSAADIYFLQVRYSPEASGILPTRLFLKINLLSKRERDFYTMIHPPMRGVTFTPRCYDAGEFYLLLEDISETHFSPDFPFAYFEKYAPNMIDLRASFHALWWEHERLQRLGEYLTDEKMNSMIQQAQAKYAQCRELMSRRQVQILDLVVNSWPERRRRHLLNGEGVTLIHGDTHPHNFMYPYDPQHRHMMLLDWQNWRLDTGMDDIACMILTHCFPETRRKLEWTLLKRYHQKLIEYGVTGYPWENCSEDYRASIVRHIFNLMLACTPARWENTGWQNRLTYSLQAFDDLACQEIF